MKVVERIFNTEFGSRLIQMICSLDIRTTDAIFIARQMQEKLRAKGKELYFGFVDLEKAFDRVLIEVIMRKLGVEEWLVLAVMSMYTGAKTVVRTVTVLR